MFGISSNSASLPRVGISESAVDQSVTRLWHATTTLARVVVSRLKTAVAYFVSPGANSRMAATTSGTTLPGTRHDRLRQIANLLLSIAQFAAAALIFSSQFGDELFYNPASRDPLIVPAGYTFSIWGFIFPASIAYGVFQALPRQRTNALLQVIGWPTAFAFGCITLWSVATLFDPIRYTVPLFFGALWGLIYAVYQLSQQERPLTSAERLFVMLPLSVYAAWCTVGTIANTSTSLAGLGYTEPFVSEYIWAIVMLVAAGTISAFTIRATRGNAAYAGGILWALIGISVANATERSSPAVAITAGVMALLVGLVLIWVRATTAQTAL